MRSSKVHLATMMAALSTIGSGIVQANAQAIDPPPPKPAKRKPYIWRQAPSANEDIRLHNERVAMKKALKQSRKAQRKGEHAKR